MTSRLILYHMPLWPGCARVVDRLHNLALDVEIRDVLWSGEARRQLLSAAGGLRLPCLVHGETVVCGAGRIEKYLELRYGK